MTFLGGSWSLAWSCSCSCRRKESRATQKEKSQREWWRGRGRGDWEGQQGGEAIVGGEGGRRWHQGGRFPQPRCRLLPQLHGRTCHRSKFLGGGYHRFASQEARKSLNLDKPFLIWYKLFQLFQLVLQNTIFQCEDVIKDIVRNCNNWNNSPAWGAPRDRRLCHPHPVRSLPPEGMTVSRVCCQGVTVNIAGNHASAAHGSRRFNRLHCVSGTWWLRGNRI